MFYSHMALLSLIYYFNIFIFRDRETAIFHEYVVALIRAVFIFNCKKQLARLGCLLRQEYSLDVGEDSTLCNGNAAQ